LKVTVPASALPKVYHVEVI